MHEINGCCFCKTHNMFECPVTKCVRSFDRLGHVLDHIWAETLKGHVAHSIFVKDALFTRLDDC